MNLPAENEDEDEDEDEGDLVVAAEGLESVDPTVLSTLPPSMQLDIMTKLREQKTYVNREGFQRRQAQPLNFSQFQMEEYLKASAIRCAFSRSRGHQSACLSTKDSWIRHCSSPESCALYLMLSWPHFPA